MSWRAAFFSAHAAVVLISCSGRASPPAAALAPVAPARRPSPVASPIDFGEVLREIGTAPDHAVDRLASAYVSRGPTALRAASDAILYGAEDVRDRGARLVLMSIERAEDLAFLEDLPPKTARTEALACGINDVARLLRQAADGLSNASGPSSPPKRPGARLPFVRAYADMLARIVDDTWPTCTRTCPTCETSRLRPEDEAVELLEEMTPLPEPAPTLGWMPSRAHEGSFRAWWRQHRARLVTP